MKVELQLLAWVGVGLVALTGGAWIAVKERDPFMGAGALVTVAVAASATAKHARRI